MKCLQTGFDLKKNKTVGTGGGGGISLLMSFGYSFPTLRLDTDAV